MESGRSLVGALRGLWAPDDRRSDPPRVPFAALVVVIFAVLVARRPAALFKPQLWAEDGTVFFRDELVHGFRHAVTMPIAGYLYLLPRVVAAAAALLPMRAAPLAYGVFSLVLGAVACSWFVRPEFRRIIRSDAQRVGASLAFACLPTAWEIIGNLANLQWYLFWLAYLLTLSPLPTAPPGQIAFVVTWLVIGLSGPTAIFLLPVWLVRAMLAERARERLLALACVAPAVVVALGMRRGAIGGTTFPPRWIVGAANFTWRLVMEPFVGETDALGLTGLGPLVPLATGAALALAGVAIVTFGSPALRGWLVASMTTVAVFIVAFVGARPGLLAVALARPAAFGGGRYFWVSANVVVLLFLIAFSVTPPPRRWLFAPLFALLVATAAAGWRSPPMAPFPGRHWNRNVARLERSMESRETCTLTIPINPDGWSFRVRLVGGRPADEGTTGMTESPICSASAR